jgi:hypothetical protein
MATAIIVKLVYYQLTLNRINHLLLVPLELITMEQPIFMVAILPKVSIKESIAIVTKLWQQHD